MPSRRRHVYLIVVLIDISWWYIIIIAIIQIQGFKCEVCGHIWISRNRQSNHLLPVLNVKAQTGTSIKERDNDWLIESVIDAKRYWIFIYKYILSASNVNGDVMVLHHILLIDIKKNTNSNSHISSFNWLCYSDWVYWCTITDSSCCSNCAKQYNNRNC